MILFENNLTLSKDKIIEISTIYRSTRRYKVMLLVGILCFIGTLLSLWWKLDIWYLGVTFGMFLYYVYIYYKKPYKEAMLLYERAKLLNGKEAQIKYTFTENKYEQYNITTGGVVEYKYEDIKKIKQTKNLYIMIIKNDIIIILDKNGFLNKTLQEFELFLEDKVDR